MTSAVERYIDALNSRDIEAIRDLYAVDARVEDPVGTDRPCVGIDAILGFYARVFEAAPTLSLTGPVRCAGNAAAFPFRSRLGAATMDIIDVFDFDDDGKVVNMRAYWGPDNTTRE